MRKSEQTDRIFYVLQIPHIDAVCSSYVGEKEIKKIYDIERK